MSEVTIRSFDWDRDRAVVEELEKKCDSPFLVTESMGDPLCRIRHSPVYEMLVAELGDELVGIIRGSIKNVTVGGSFKGNIAKVGYILGLRVSPFYRRRGIGLCLVSRMEEWFVANLVDYVYMATDKDNRASRKLFTENLSYVEFRRPVILVNPVGRRTIQLSSNIEIQKLDTTLAEKLYRRFMGETEFFSQDIDRILANKLSLGTWVAFPKVEIWNGDNPNVSSWVMLSVWNCGDVFKLRVGRASVTCVLLAEISRLINSILPCLEILAVPDIFTAFGFYFIYGIHGEGPEAAVLIRSLCHYVHNMAMRSENCDVVVTEVAARDINRTNIPHSKLLSCSEDLWCIKSLKKTEDAVFMDWANAQPTTLFVDPREVKDLLDKRLVGKQSTLDDTAMAEPIIAFDEEGLLSSFCKRKSKGKAKLGSKIKKKSLKRLSCASDSVGDELLSALLTHDVTPEKIGLCYGPSMEP